MKDVCKRYALPYNTGPVPQQWWMVHRTIARLAFPGGKARPKPGAYTGDDTEHVVVDPVQAGVDGAATNGSGNGKPAATEDVPAEGPRG